MKRLFLKAAGAAAAGALLQACGGGGGGGGGSGNPSGSQTLLQLLQQDGRFSTLLSAVQNAGLADQLGQAGASQTLFAPDNDAFARLASRTGTLSDAKLAEFVSFHVVRRFYSAAALRSLAASSPNTADTLFGDAPPNEAKLIFFTDNGQLNIWDGIGRTSITITEPDLAANNGVLHVVSDVMVPRGVLTVSQILRASIDSFSEFAASMVNSGATGAFSGSAVTVFVPDNSRADASALTNSQVLHHAVAGEIGSNAFTTRTLTPLSGGALRLVKGPPDTINGRNITDVDFFGSNGVIHVIDGILP